MIELSWGNLKNNDFMMSLQKLFAAPMGFHNAQKFVLLGRAIKDQQAIVEATHKKILEKFGTPEENNPGSFTIPEENRKGYGEEMEKLMKNKFKCRIKRVDASSLQDTVKFSPQDLLLLEDILLPLEELEGEVSEIQKGQEAQPEATAH